MSKKQEIFLSIGWIMAISFIIGSTIIAIFSVWVLDNKTLYDKIETTISFGIAIILSSLCLIYYIHKIKSILNEIEATTEKNSVTDKE